MGEGGEEERTFAGPSWELSPGAEKLSTGSHQGCSDSLPWAWLAQPAGAWLASFGLLTTSSGRPGIWPAESAGTGAGRVGRFQNERRQQRGRKEPSSSLPNQVWASGRGVSNGLMWAQELHNRLRTGGGGGRRNGSGKQLVTAVEADGLVEGPGVAKGLPLPEARG